jgi:hypothetical protein
MRAPLVIEGRVRRQHAHQMALVEDRHCQVKHAKGRIGGL